jgi:hypothetical protein
MTASEDLVSLANLGNGAAIELFNAELQKVLNNIVDENTRSKDTRKVILEVTIKPTEDRDFGQVSIVAKSKLALIAPYATNFLIGKQRGKGVAQERNPKQTQLFDSQDDELRVVSPINGRDNSK